jgi:hypothetical protein
MFGTAGVPQSLAAGRDWDAVFCRLKSAGITLFFPTFQSQEAPEPDGLGYEADFARAGPAYDAARRHGVQILLPASIIYPNGFIPYWLSRDPLKKLLGAVGPGVIAGVFSWDEPVHQGVTLAQCRALYYRVKKIDRSLPVVMVHAPRILDVDRDWAKYFADVKAYSAWSNMAGFDVYPITPEMMQQGTPQGELLADPVATVLSYTDWLAANLPNKARIMVLQGFPQTAVYSDEWLAANTTSEQRALARAPTPEETADMANAVAPHCMVTMWWGPSLLADETKEPWPAVLGVTGAGAAVAPSAPRVYEC